jgi:hypothetical protein
MARRRYRAPSLWITRSDRFAVAGNMRYQACYTALLRERLTAVAGDEAPPAHEAVPLYCCIAALLRASAS